MEMNVRKIKFQKPQFKQVLNQRIKNYFLENHKKEQGNLLMYLKVLGILAWFAISYYLLVFTSTSIWEGIGYSVLFAASWVAVGFNIQHDANHGAISKKAWINRMLGCTLDFLMGLNSRLWHFKHNQSHHTYTNISDADEDISLGWFARFTPTQSLHSIHKYQHLYMWVLYGVMIIRWQLFSDVLRFFYGKTEKEKMIMHTPGNIVLFFAGKICFLTLFFIVPMLFHPWWVVLLFYAVLFFFISVFLVTIFQLAHCVNEAEHPELHEEKGYMIAEDEWIRHQLRTTVDFAPKNWLVTFYLGGLNYQVEHHLWTRTCHIHYPKIAAILEKTCKEFGLPYKSNPRFLGALASHYRFLKQMGQPIVQT